MDGAERPRNADGTAQGTLRFGLNAQPQPAGSPSGYRPARGFPYNKGKRRFSGLRAWAVAVLAGAQTGRRTGFRTPCGAGDKERFMTPSSIFSFLPAIVEQAAWGPRGSAQVAAWGNRADPVPVTPHPPFPRLRRNRTRNGP